MCASTNTWHVFTTSSLPTSPLIFHREALSDGLKGGTQSGKADFVGFRRHKSAIMRAPNDEGTLKWLSRGGDQAWLDTYLYFGGERDTATTTLDIIADANHLTSSHVHMLRATFEMLRKGAGEDMSDEVSDAYSLINELLDDQVGKHMA